LGKAAVILSLRNSLPPERNPLQVVSQTIDEQGKFQEALEICEGTMKSLQEIGGQRLGKRHKFATMLREEINKPKVKI
jgi:hypothetical protein